MSSSMRSTVASTRFRVDAALRLRRKKGHATNHATRPDTSRHLTRRSRAARAHRTRTPPDAHRAHRNAAANARRDSPPRAAPPTEAHEGNTAPAGTQTKPPTNGPPSTGDPRTTRQQRSEQRRIPPATEDDDRDAGRRSRTGRSERTTRHGREQEPAHDRHRDATRDERHARTRRQPLPQRGRQRTAREPDRGRASRNHGLDHGESREAPEARARRIPSAEDRDPSSSATHRQRLQRQRIPASSAADRERGTRGSREDTADHAADERAEARRQLPRTTETDRANTRHLPSERTPPPETPAADEDIPQARKPKGGQGRRRSGSAQPCAPVRDRSQGRPERASAAAHPPTDAPVLRRPARLAPLR